MELTNLLIEFWGFYLVIVSAIFILRPSTKTHIIELAKKPIFGVLAGFMALLLGLASLVVYHEWHFNISVVPTLFGIVALIKGISLIAFPTQTSKWIKILESPIFPFLMIAMLFGGIALLWFGAGLR